MLADPTLANPKDRAKPCLTLTSPSRLVASAATRCLHPGGSPRAFRPPARSVTQ